MVAQEQCPFNIHHNTHMSFTARTGQRLWLDPATGAVTETLPPGRYGGLLCEDMGLGKTIECIALIIANPRRERAGEREALQRRGAAGAAFDGDDSDAGFGNDDGDDDGGNEDGAAPSAAAAAAAAAAPPAAKGRRKQTPAALAAAAATTAAECGGVSSGGLGAGGDNDARVANEYGLTWLETGEILESAFVKLLGEAYSTDAKPGPELNLRRCAVSGLESRCKWICLRSWDPAVEAICAGLDCSSDSPVGDLPLSAAYDALERYSQAEGGQFDWVATAAIEDAIARATSGNGFQYEGVKLLINKAIEYVA